MGKKTVMIQLLSGHTLLNSHRAKMNSNVSDSVRHVVRRRTQTIFYFIARDSGKRENNWKTKCEEILNGTCLNEVANIDLAVLVGMVKMRTEIPKVN